MKKLMMFLAAASLSMLGASTLAAQSAPKSVMHVVTVAWKADATPEQIQAALDGVKALPSQYKGITHVWTKTLKVQDAKGAEVKKSHVIAMEFADEAAFKGYTDSAAQKEWYKSYLPIRQASTTFDVTN